MALHNLTKEEPKSEITVSNQATVPFARHIIFFGGRLFFLNKNYENWKKNLENNEKKSEKKRQWARDFPKFVILRNTPFFNSQR